MKFWRLRKYTIAFRFSTNPALLIADVAWRWCMLSPLLFRSVTALSLKSDFIIGFPKLDFLSLNSANLLNFRRCSVLLLKVSNRFRCGCVLIGSLFTRFRNTDFRFRNQSHFHLKDEIQIIFMVKMKPPSNTL